LLDAVSLFGWDRPAKFSKDAATRDVVLEIVGMIARTLQEFVRNHGIEMPTIYAEPGRALVASGQLLLLRVEAVKTRPRGNAVAVCDAGALSLSPLLLSETHAILVANKADYKRTARYDLLGNLPAPLDVVAIGRELPLLEKNDIVAVMDTGAYFTALGNNFAGPRPALVTVDDGTATLARRRESFEDMISRDAV